MEDKILEAYAEKKGAKAQNVIEELETDSSKIGDHTVYEEKYFMLKTKLKILIDETSSRSSATTQNKINSTQKRNISKMPEIVIEKFVGVSHNWQSFFDIFQALVLNNPQLEDIQKLIYLKSDLKG